jgi:spermidine synthase
VEVVEIDPAVVEVGRRFFQLDRYPQLHIVVDDARRYLSRTQTKYHLIFGDAYNGLRSVPAHLLTREFFQSVQNRLDEQGIFMINIISAVKGRNSGLFLAVMKTISQVFPETQVFATVPQKLSQLQSIIIVAANSDLRWDPVLSEIPPDKNHLRKLLLTRISPQQYTTRNGHFLTDSFNPVEYLAAQTLQK